MEPLLVITHPDCALHHPLRGRLEGGYDLKALTDCVLAFSEGITFDY